MVRVAVYVEGHTEWHVMRTLYKNDILDGMDFIGVDKKTGKSTKKTIVGGVHKFPDALLDPDGKKGILLNPPSNRILLVFDQEKKNSLCDSKSDIVTRLQEHKINFNFSQLADFPNVFIGVIYMKRRTLSVAIHVADKEGPDGNRDFDGYLVELLQSPGGVSIMEGMLNGEDREKAEVVNYIGNRKIPDSMEECEYPIKRSKTILYSHITAMQFGKSHTFFSEDVVDKSDKQDLENTFASLIAAWNALKKENDT